MSGDAPAVSARRNRWLTLLAMTLAGSMILVDQTAVPLAIPHIVGGLDAPLSEGQWVLTANILPLAAFMVLGGRLGDILGLRRVFLTGAIAFIGASALAGAAQDIDWLIVMRAVQGAGAALMMPTSIAIVSAVFARGERGRALGLLAGASAFFAALGPFVGGALTQWVDWRAVFFVNVPLAAATILITLWATPPLRAPEKTTARLDYTGIVLFAVAISALVIGLGEGRVWGWGSAPSVGTLVASAIAFVLFVVVELRSSSPLMEFGLLRNLNFAAANISQLVAGAIELGVGFVMPLYLLRILGMDPGVAGLALVAATLPIIVVAPLGGRAFDRIGGRWPLVLGFAALAASSFWIAAFVSRQEFAIIVPGLVLQGIGLGIVLTVNDPTGINAVPSEDRGQAAGVINTSEQLGGALGIAGLTAVLFTSYFRDVDRLAGSRGSTVTADDVERFRSFILHVEEVGVRNVHESAFIRHVLPVTTDAFVDGFQLTMLVVGALALLGALACFALVRQTDRVIEGPIFTRRSRWLWLAPPRSSGPPVSSPAAALGAPAGSQGPGPPP